MARIEVVSEVAGTVWKCETTVGDQLDDGAVVLILESMKMEIPVEAPVAGRLAELLVGEGDAVAEEQVVAVIEAP